MLSRKSRLLAIVSVMVLGLMVTGVVGLSGGNGPMDGSCDNPLERDHDDDGVLNHEDEDWTPPEDGSGYGVGGEKGQDFGQGESGYGSGDGTCDGNGPHGNSGQGQNQGQGQGQGRGKGRA
ncbi:hypothetical protein KGY71_05440 [Candidatus Bipolaricaulota bacterium]|nr:hypothetical protein [Candidatus Bipolaricaulota bacterium]